MAVDEAPAITVLGAWLRENGLEEYEDSLETQGGNGVWFPTHLSGDEDDLSDMM